MLILRYTHTTSRLLRITYSITPAQCCTSLRHICPNSESTTTVVALEWIGHMLAEVEALRDSEDRWKNSILWSHLPVQGCCSAQRDTGGLSILLILSVDSK